ncbi:GDP-mannose 4,6-dehydratase, partial [Candidatus Pelagibacter sp.]|nr:GDP-mannose 4,6-dehydratase [Candidatus Pelagibacter sp.]
TYKNFLHNVDFVNDRPGHDKRYAIDGTKIKKLGWIPKINFEQGIEETVKWYLENENWWRNILKNKYKLERIGKIK